MAASRLNRVSAVAANTFRETVRERVLFNLVFFAVLMTLSGLLMQQLSIRQDEKILKDFGLAATDIFGTLIAMFVGVGLVAKEIERRSLYALLAKPVTRGEFVLGKFLGLAFTLLVNTGIMGAGVFATLWLTRGRVDLNLVKALFGIYLGLLLVVAIALLFSAVTSPALAAICTVSLVVAGRFSDVIKDMREIAPAVPEWLANAMYYLIPNFHDFDLKNRVVYGDLVSFQELWWKTLYALAYVSVVLALTVRSFRSRDLK